jgi:hypothetical protein
VKTSGVGTSITAEREFSSFPAAIDIHVGTHTRQKKMEMEAMIIIALWALVWTGIVFAGGWMIGRVFATKQTEPETTTSSADLQRLEEYDTYFKADEEAILRMRAVTELSKHGMQVKLCETARWNGNAFTGPILTLTLKTKDRAVVKYDDDAQVKEITIFPEDEQQDKYDLVVG